jgi:predicted phage baseplate assembly protein
VPLREATPVIDDRRYDHILAEIRARIARYTPEWKPVWSDVNDSDPGITLAQVFAWLSEMLLYRMARVPELNYIKFLELLGEELRAARPAAAEITFTVSDAWPGPTVDVPAGTQVSAASEGPPTVFETERPLRAVACQLRSVQAYDAAQYRDVTVENEGAAEGFLPFGELPREDGALTLGLGFPGGHANENDFPPLIMDLTVWVADPPGDAARMRTCGPLTTRAFAPARLQWEGWDGARWRPIDTIADETLAFTQTGRVQVRVPASLTLVRARIGTYDTPDPVTGNPRLPLLFWLRARLTESQYERAPRLLAVRTNTVSALQAQTVLGEILGGATGGRNQRFQLANAPVIQDSLHVTIDDGTGAREWLIKDDLLGSGRNDEHLALSPATGELRAGDGENGAIPVANPANRDANVVAVRYRYGGGTRGNVAAKSIRNLLTPVPGLDAGKTGNLFPAAGGTNEEDIEEAKKRARLSLRARERAVTPEDFELLARAAGVKRAKALPLFHPLFPGVKVPGAVTVIVVPESPSAAPTPSDGLLRTVCRYLDERRLLTTEVFVVAPRYVTVSSRLQVVVRDDFDPGTVKQAAEEALSNYFHPLKGGDEGSGWPFGGPLRYSKIVQRVFGVAGVDSVPELTLIVDGETAPPCSDVILERIAPFSLLTSVDHAVDVLTRQEHEGLEP